LNEEIEKLLLDQGAVSVGFATKHSLKGGPLTTDMTYILPEAEKADELEKAGKIGDPYRETSERRQNVEKIVSDIFKKLRKEQVDTPLHEM